MKFIRQWKNTFPPQIGGILDRAIIEVRIRRTYTYSLYLIDIYIKSTQQV